MKKILNLIKFINLKRLYLKKMIVKSEKKINLYKKNKSLKKR